MTLAEVMVSALILSISAQTSLQGWGRSSSAVQAVATLQDASQALELYRLASLRLLRMPIRRSCWDQPTATAVSRSSPCVSCWSATCRRLGCGAEVHPPSTAMVFGSSCRIHYQRSGPLQRRALLTPAGLGLCGLTP